MPPAFLVLKGLWGMLGLGGEGSILSPAGSARLTLWGLPQPLQRAAGRGAAAWSLTGCCRYPKGACTLAMAPVSPGAAGIHHCHTEPSPELTLRHCGAA